MHRNPYEGKSRSQWQPYPALAVLWSLLLPGLGSIYGGSQLHGAIILGVYVTAWQLAWLTLGLALPLVAVVWLWGVIAAFVLAWRG